MILKEAFNNSIKYASCSNIRINIYEEANRLKFQYKDDGMGFEPTTEINGYGLKNMSYRAQSIGYKVEVTTSPGNVVMITLTSL